METVTLSASRRFRSDKLSKVPLFDTEKLFYDLYCLRPGQEQRVHSHAGEDKVYLVLEGEALFDVGDERELLPEGTAVIARAGEPHGVRNDSDSDVVLLVTMAPRPR